MKLALIQTAEFARRWRQLGLTDEDAQELEAAVMERPMIGEVMRGTGGLRKMRFSPSRWKSGKSGALRIGYAYFPAFEQVWFLTAFPKNVQANLSAAERAVVRVTIEAIQRWLGQRERQG